MPTASALVQRLRTVGSDLPSDLAAQVVALGREATPFLLHLLERHPADEDDGLGAPDGCSDCGQQNDGLEWARLHAADLLADLRDPLAIERMLKALEDSSSDDPIHDKLVERLPDFGDAALEPTLAALARTSKDTEGAEALCCILSVLGVRDERILQSLLDLLTVHPRAGAMYLAEYGDPAACSALLTVIAAFEVDSNDSFLRMELLDLLDAYTSLGGELPASVKARIETRLGE